MYIAAGEKDPENIDKSLLYMAYAKGRPLWCTAKKEFYPVNGEEQLIAVVLYDGATKFDSVANGNLFGFQW